MTGSMGSSSSRRHKTVIYAAKNFMTSSIADHAINTKVEPVMAKVFQKKMDTEFPDKYGATSFSSGITTATVTMPARKASAMSLRGSGGGAGLRPPDPKP